MGIDAILALGGLIIPPAFDFIKKKFVKNGDTPNATASTLATTKPEILPDYMESVSKLTDADVKWFNRDVIGTPSQWVVDVRACIRPISVIIGFLLLGLDMLNPGMLDAGTRGSIIVNNSSWFGSRIR